jgi:GT2 family glycosyltransferase
MDFSRDQYEVIVVDDGSRTPVDQVVDARSGSIAVTLVRIQHGGPGAARNAGVRQARGKLLAFIDDDCTAHPRWLDELSARLQANPGAAVGGRVVNALALNPYARASQCLQDYVYKWYHQERRGELSFFTTNNLGIARSDFDVAGPFDESFPFASEDREWCDRALYRGLRLVYAPEVIVEHSHHLGLGSFFVQHYRYGKGAARFHAVRATRRSNPVRLEPLEFYRGMFSAPFHAREPSPAFGMILLFVSQTASFMGFAREWNRS